MDELTTIKNFKGLEQVFKMYMKNEHNITVLDPAYKRSMYNAIKAIHSNSQYAAWSLRELNKLVLKQTEAAYKELNPVTGLEREQQIFGNRDVKTTSDFLVPQNTSVIDEKSAVNKQFEELVLLRTGVAPIATLPHEPKEPEKPPGPLSADEFSSKLKELESGRLETNVDIQRYLEAQPDPKAIFAKDFTRGGPVSIDDIQNSAGPPAYIDRNMDIITPQKHSDRIATKFVTLNGFDRDWVLMPNRYKFSIDVSSMSKTYRNISTLECTRLLIPMEIMDQRTITNVPKFNYYHEYNLSFPYLILQIDEFNDMYDGLNQQIQKGFTTFIYDKSYRGTNGRGYIVMQPMQQEVKEFTPSPLAGLQRLTMSIVKPNGALFNNSLDDYRVIKVEYEEFNSIYLKIILDKWFDKNEFFAGDTIMIRNFALPYGIDRDLLNDFKTLTPEEFKVKRGYDRPNPLPQAYGEYCQNEQAYNALAEFMNRPQGHEIVGLGEANDNGYYKTFTIFAPGVLDQTRGKLTINEDIVCIIKDHNQKFCLTPGGENHPIGAALNMSLQCVVSMRIGTKVPNAVPTIDTRKI